MFNSESRWDRHLPQESRSEEPIEVGAVFTKGQIVPRWFVWKSRKYQIKDVTYRWSDKQGDEVLHFFAVTDGVNLYQIHFNNRRLHWRLDQTSPL